jgi:tRNA (adenine37-N6)-methyltransferase
VTATSGNGLVMRPIGLVHTPYVRQEGTPIQGSFAPGAEGTVEVLPDYAAGLADIDGFSHLILIYAFDRVRQAALRVRPYLDTEERGVFATRSPARPNPIGITVVRLLGVEGQVLRVCGVDMLDGTPVLDIKPYLPDFDSHPDARTGWFERCRRADGSLPPTVADGRFERGRG